MSLEAGHKLAHYEILEPIGKGGMGEVYRARDGKLGRDVAIKVLPDEFAQNQERLARFKREAKVLASLNHPNIASIYGLERSESTHYLVLELVPGETLAERISRGPIPVEEAIAIAVKIVDALEEAHERGIVHRDFKPANIKQTEDGKVIVLDFGLAKAFLDETPDADSSTSPTLTRDATRAGVILGTAAYMSPEQAKGKKVDKRADIFAFGAVLYEMLTGKKAFPGENMSEVLAAVIKSEPDWTALPPAARDDVEKLMRWCLAKDVTHRLRDIGDARPGLRLEPSSERTQSGTMAPWLWSLAAFALGALMAGWISRAPSEKVPTSVVRFLTEDVPYTDTFGGERSLDLSPDGRHLVYLSEQNGQTHLKLRALDQAEPTIMRGTEGASSVYFSPDGQQVLFKQEAKLMTASLQGGTPTKLVDMEGNLLSAHGVSWAPDGTIVYRRGRTLWRTAANDADPTPVTELDVSRGERSHRFPHVLPDGRHLLFTVDHQTMESFDDARIALAPLDGSERPRVLIEGGTSPVYVPTGHIVYARTGSLLAVPFDVERLEVTGSSRVVVEGVQTNPLHGNARYAVSSSGSLAFVRGGEQSGSR